MQPINPPDIKGLPVSEAMAKLKKFEEQLSYEQLQEYKRTQLRPHRTRNLLLAGAIWTGVLAVCKLITYLLGRRPIHV